MCPDTDEARLVVLDPTSPHDSKTEQSEALKMAQQTLLERAGGARQHRNMLVFLAADITRLGELRQAVRNHLAWQSIRDDAESLNLDPPNARQAESKAARCRRDSGVPYSRDLHLGAESIATP